eukprot:15457618-Alexandrium_andersonii.AAC.1
MRRRVVPQASAPRASARGFREDSFNVPPWRTGEGACTGCSASEVFPIVAPRKIRFQEAKLRGPIVFCAVHLWRTAHEAQP